MTHGRPEHTEEISAPELRGLFNRLDIWGRVLDGELTALTLEEHPAPRSAGQRPGTTSRIDIIYDAGTEVARVHYYLEPDGTIGGSGLVDPKSLFHDGVLYVLIGRSPRGFSF